MRKTLGLAMVLVVALAAGFSCKGRGSSLVRVGSSSITEGDLETLARVNPRLKPRLATPAGKQKILENYVEQELLYQESIRRGLQRTPNVKDKTALYEKIIVAQALLDDELDKKVKEYYENHKDEFERVKVSHILIRAAAPEEPKPADKKDAKKAPPKPKVAKRSEAEALKLAESARDRIAKGEEFGKVAKEISEDEKTKNNQGDLGYITLRDKRLERWGWLSLAEKAFALKVGEASDPIKTKDGFHIVRVTEEKKQQPFEEAEAGIKFRLQADIRTQLLGDLKKKYKVEFAKAEAAGKAEPSTPAPAPAAPETAPAEPSPPPPAEAPPAAPTAPEGVQ